MKGNYRLLKDTLYVSGRFHCVLRAGEECAYFQHSDTYVFDQRGGYVPFYGRELVESEGEWFKLVE